jgi:predicted O-methyltransferase YrrM
MKPSIFSLRTWVTCVAGGGILTALLGGVLTVGLTGAWVSIAAGALLSGLLGGGGLAICAILDIGFNKMNHRIIAAEREVQDLINLRPLLPEAVTPLDVGGWAATAELLKILVQEIRQSQPSLILECGSGTSTVLMATCLKRFGINGRVIALDHDPTYARQTRDLLVQYGVSNYAEVVTAPLEPNDVNGQTISWYTFNPEEHLHNPIDLMFVDGPPGGAQPMARYPAIPMLKNYLSVDCTIVLDDGDRDDERAAAHRWAQTLHAEAELKGTLRPCWVLR